MVKNNGGNKAKKMGRKFTSSGAGQAVTRLSECEEEMYACVTKYYGSGMCDVICIDGESRMCVIRKKFRGRSKRHNIVSVGSYVLVGLRDWEVVAAGKKRKCDLLEVYNQTDIEKIRRFLTEEEWHLIKYTSEDIVDDDDSGIVFVDEETARYEEMQRDTKNTKITFQEEGSSGGGGGEGGSGRAEIKEASSDEEFDIDDI